MKKVIALLLAVLTVCSLAACAAKAPAEDQTDKDQTTENQTTEDQKPEEETVKIPDALTLLNEVWAKYAEEDKFSAAGGDYDEANMKDDAPGKVGLAKPEDVEYLLSFPQADVEKIDDAASLMHMMNANTFTCGALRVKNGDDAAKLAEDLRDAIQNKQWMCGFPDKLVIATLGNYVVSVYGDEELVNTFRDKLQAAYSDAAIAYDEMIGEGEFSDGEDTALEAPVA